MNKLESLDKLLGKIDNQTMVNHSEPSVGGAFGVKVDDEEYKKAVADFFAKGIKNGFDFIEDYSEKQIQFIIALILVDFVEIVYLRTLRELMENYFKTDNKGYLALVEILTVGNYKKISEVAVAIYHSTDKEVMKTFFDIVAKNTIFYVAMKRINGE